MTHEYHNSGTYYIAKAIFIWEKVLINLILGGRGWIGVWTQSFTLAKQVPYHLSHTSSPFCSAYFGDRGLSNYLPTP
jgi:hypothetical protein